MKKRIFFILLLSCFSPIIFAQNFSVSTDTLIYKEVDGVRLKMVVYKPQISTLVKVPAIVFYFGGGWVSGNPGHFEMQARYLASRGMIAVCPDYRTKSKNNTSPFECVKDAKSAFRYLKTNGSEMGIDTSRIVAAGGSAGGHLAASLATLKNVNEDSDDLSVLTIPFALVLFNPVIDTSDKGYGAEKLKGHEFELSPVHHVYAGVPRTIIFHGKNDTTVPYENVVRFKHLMHQEGNECILKGFKRQKHGFFNFSRNQKCFKKTLKLTEKFLDDLDLLKGESWLNQYYKELKKSKSIS